MIEDLSDEKTQAAVKGNFMKKRYLVKNSPCDVELAKAQVEHKTPDKSGILFLSICKTMIAGNVLQLFMKSCDVNKLEHLEKDTDLLNLTLEEKHFEDFIASEMGTQWEHLRSTDCDDGFSADQVGRCFPKCVVLFKRIKTSENLGSSKRSPDA